MAVIGAINVLMTSDIKGLLKGTKGARAALDVLKGGIITIAAGSAAALLGIGAAAIASAHSMTELGREADKVGTSVEAFSRLSFAAKQLGVDSSALGDYFSKLNKNLHQAATVGGPAAGVLEAMGLEAKELVREDPAEAFKQIASGIAQLPNQADRAAAAFALFGKGGSQLLNVLNSDGDAINKLMAESDALGATVSGLDKIKVTGMIQAFGKVEAFLTGISNKIAAEVAPYVTALIDAFLDWAKTSVNSGDLVAGALNLVIEGIAFVADAIDALVITWKALKVGASVAVGAIIKGLAFLARGIDAVTSHIPGMATNFASTLDDMGKGVDDLIKDQMGDLDKAMSGPSSGDKVRTFLHDIKTGADASAAAMDNLAKSTREANRGVSESFEGIGEFQLELQKTIATWGMSGEAAKLWELKAHGATDEQLKGAKDLIKQLNTMRSLEDMATPIEKTQLAVDRLNKEFQQGLIDSTGLQMGLAKLGKDLAGDVMSKHAGALEAGSKEARTTLLEASSQQTDPDKERKRLAELALTAANKGNENTSALVELFRGIKVVTA